MGILSSIVSRNIIQHSRLGNVEVGSLLIGEQDIATLKIVQALPNFDPVLKWLIYLREISPMYTMSKVTTNKQQNQMRFHFKQPSQQTLNLSSIFLPLSYRWKKQGLCGSEGTLTVQYERLMFDMQSEVQCRQQQGKYFLQTEIWYLLYKLIELLTQLSRLKRRVGNLQPRNILIDEQGRIRVITKYSLFGQQLDEYHLMSTGSQLNSFLSPQQLHDPIIHLSANTHNNHHQKSQLYSLAITILSIGTLSHGYIFYTINHQSQQLISIDYELIKHKMESFREHYSTFLAALLQGILKTNPNERRSAGQVYDSIKIYEKEILDLQPFMRQYEQRRLNQSNITQKKLTNRSNAIPQRQSARLSAIMYQSSRKQK